MGMLVVYQRSNMARLAETRRAASLLFPEENYLMVTLITCAPDTTQSIGAEASFTAEPPITTMWPRG